MATKSRPRKRSKHHRHPATQTSRERRKGNLTPLEAGVRDLNRAMRHEMRARGMEGLITAPLAVAAKHGAPMLAHAHGLIGDEHEAAIEQWLVGMFGQVLHDFDPQAYLAWREDCRERALASV